MTMSFPPQSMARPHLGIWKQSI